MDPTTGLLRGGETMATETEKEVVTPKPGRETEALTGVELAVELNKLLYNQELVARAVLAGDIEVNDLSDLVKSLKNTQEVNKIVDRFAWGGAFHVK